MNIALPAILVFIILLPGFLSNQRYKRVERASLDYAPFSDTVASAVVFGFVLHAVWLVIGYLVFRRVLDLSILLGLLSANADLQRQAIESVADQSGIIILYFATITLVPYLVLPGVRQFIELRRWDTTRSWLSPIFRFDAPWYYLFSAADLAISFDSVVITAVVEVGGEAILYRGTLVEYFVTRDGALDRVVLELVTRRRFSEDRSEEGQRHPDDEFERFYTIMGDYFVLRYADVSSLNVEYLILDESEPVPDP